MNENEAKDKSGVTDTAAGAGKTGKTVINSIKESYKESRDGLIGGRKKRDPDAPRPLRWYKCLIYFALFALALLGLYNAVVFISGTYWDMLGYPSVEIYEASGALKTADMVYGLAMGLSAVLSIVVRFRLAGYKREAPGNLIALLTLNAVCTILYYFVAMPKILYGTVDLSGALLGCGASCLTVYLNKLYFDKRAALFVK